MQIEYEVKQLTPTQLYQGMKKLFLQSGYDAQSDDDHYFQIFTELNSDAVHIIHIPGSDIQDCNGSPPLSSFLPENLESIAKLNTQGNVHHHIVIAESNNRRHFVYAHIHNNHIQIYDSIPKYPKNYDLLPAITLIKSAFEHYHTKKNMTYAVDYLNLQLGNVKCGFHCLQFIQQVIKNLPLTWDTLTINPQDRVGHLIPGLKIVKPLFSGGFFNNTAKKVESGAKRPNLTVESFLKDCHGLSDGDEKLQDWYLNDDEDDATDEDSPSEKTKK